MKLESPLVIGLLIVFAAIGLLAVLAILGMSFMHGGMMGAFGRMMSACQAMMTMHR